MKHLAPQMTKRKIILKSCVAVLLIAGAAFLAWRSYVFYKCEMGLHVIDNETGRVCPCEYGELHVEVNDDGQAQCRMLIASNASLYVQVEEEADGLSFWYSVWPSWDRIPVEYDEQGYAVFSIDVPPHMFRSPDGYCISTYGSGTKWHGSKQAPFLP